MRKASVPWRQFLAPSRIRHCHGLERTTSLHCHPSFKMSSSSGTAAAAAASTTTGTNADQHPDQRRQHRQKLHNEDGRNDEGPRLWYDATISSLSKLTPTVTSVTLYVDTTTPSITHDEGKTWNALALDTTNPFTFLPGQWVDFYIPVLNRVGGYSITSLPSHLPQLELAVKESRHPPAEWVTKQSKVGDVVRIRVGGEFIYSRPTSITGKAKETNVGVCTVPTTSSASLFVAGGVGINPLYGMLRQLHSDLMKGQNDNSEQGTKAVLLYSASTENELLFESELSAMETNFPSNFKMMYRVTQEGNTKNAMTKTRRGRISSNDIGEAIQWVGGSVDSVYVCGPPGMAEAIRDVCCKRGISRSVINFEQWW